MRPLPSLLHISFRRARSPLAKERRAHVFHSTVYRSCTVLLRKRLMAQSAKCFLYCSHGEEYDRKEMHRGGSEGCCCGRQDLETEASALLEHVRKGGHWGGAAGSWNPLRRMCSRVPGPLPPSARPPACNPAQFIPAPFSEARSLHRCLPGTCQPEAAGRMSVPISGSTLLLDSA